MASFNEYNNTFFAQVPLILNTESHCCIFSPVRLIETSKLKG